VTIAAAWFSTRTLRARDPDRGRARTFRLPRSRGRDMHNPAVVDRALQQMLDERAALGFRRDEVVAGRG